MQVSATISGDSYQSRRWPRDSTSCTQAMAVERATKPIQSSRTRAPGLSGGSAKRSAKAASAPAGTIM
jgi:hypothetical protein